LTNLRIASSACKKLVDNNESIWKQLFSRHFLDTFLPISKNSNVDWRREFIKTWKIEKSNHWIEITKKTNVFTNKNKTILHGEGTYYLSVRAKHGTLSISTTNSHIQVTIAALTTGRRFRPTANLKLPTPTSEFVTNTLIIPIFSDMTRVCTFLFFSYLQMLGASMVTKGSCRNKPIADASKTFTNHDRVGLLLNMDECTLVIFVNGNKVLTFACPEWKVKRRFILC
jgi:hypothetical protein